MTDNELKEIMRSLYIQLKSNDSDPKLILAKAVSLGMKYQEEKIKNGISVVFENLNLPV